MSPTTIVSVVCLISLNITPLHAYKCGKVQGKPFHLAVERIVAGYDVGYYRYSWYSSLMIGNVSACGGVLVAPKTVLTAASCFKNYLSTDGSVYKKLESIYNVSLGMYNNCLAEDHRRSYQIEKVNVHEMYLKKRPFYDIALLTLMGSTSSYKPICLPSLGGKTPLEGTVLGMGALKFNGSVPCTLHEARLLIYPEEKCRDIITKSGNNASAMINVFCAGYTTANADTCQGDSGSPLQVMTENGDFVLLGLVSFGYHCANPNIPGMYTDVSKYLEWIKVKSGLDVQTALMPIKIPTSQSGLIKPFKRFVVVIIIKNGKVTVIKKPVLHYPVSTNQHLTNL
ncbi:proclotting enzyme-like [Aethina tumida]|uniref:proclotting enzyme-like n=1 Tax=Aethina tumida TaxID=116153 RepID=UPI002147ACDE|nr:proclotting enzyme-like [Aethina tumida]